MLRFKWKSTLFWNQLTGVRQVRNPNKPGKTISDAWKRSRRDPEQSERLNDFEAIRNAIVKADADYLSGGWFTAANIIGGKNSNKIWYAEQLLNGVYARKSERNGKTVDELYDTHDPQPEFA